MHIVILGAGTVGVQIAQTLSQEKHHIVLIERARQRAMHVQARVDCKVLVDEGTQREVLQAADIESADYFVAATDSDEVNLIACNIAKRLSKNIKCIGRIRTKEYLQNYKELEETFHVDYIVHPEREVAFSIIRSIEYGGGVSDVFTFQDFGRIIMRNFIVPEHSVIIGKQLKYLMDVAKIPKALEGKFLFVLINRNNESIVPSGDMELQAHDEIFILGEHRALDSLLGYLGRKTQEARNIRRIMIIGGGEVGAQLVDCYLDMQSNNLFSIMKKRRFAMRDITIVENDITRCRQLADMYHDTTILHADVSEENVLEEIEIDSFDMVIATTESQERNIVLAAHSKNLGVRHTIALVESQVYLTIANELGIGYSLSVKTEVTESIRTYLSGQASLYSIIRERSYEIFRCNVHPDSKTVSLKIIDITLPEKSILLSIYNKDAGAVIATGNTTITAHDTVLCLAPSSEVEKIHNLFDSKKTFALEAATTPSDV